MASNHPYSGHRESAVGHRRAKLLMKSGGYVKGSTRRYQNGGAAADEPETPACPEPDADDMPVTEGQKRGGRLDKKARGGKIAKRQTGGEVPLPRRRPWKPTPEEVEGFGRKDGGKVKKFANGGGVRNITPSKRKPHKPHVNVNVINVTRGGGPRPMGGLRPPMGLRPPLAIRPPVPIVPGVGAPGAARLPGATLPLPRPGGMPLRPPGMAKGGAAMRKGKKYGEGSGEGRLEEYEHNKGR